MSILVMNLNLTEILDNIYYIKIFLSFLYSKDKKEKDGIKRKFSLFLVDLMLDQNLNNFLK